MFSLVQKGISYKLKGFFFFQELSYCEHVDVYYLFNYMLKISPYEAKGCDENSVSLLYVLSFNIYF